MDLASFFYYDTLSVLMFLIWWGAGDCKPQAHKLSTSLGRLWSFLHSRNAKGAFATMMWHSLTFYTSLERRRVTERTRSWREKSISSLCSATGPCAATATWAIGSPKSTLFWLGASHQGHVCVLKKTLRNAFSLLAAPMHLTVCISKAVFPCSIPTLTGYPPNTNICHLY